MLKRLSTTDVMSVLLSALSDGVGVKAYDVPPRNATPPLVYCELTDIQDVGVKPIFATQYSVSVHLIAKNNGSHIPLFNLIQQFEQALTSPMAVDGGELYRVGYGGITNIYAEDETNEYHAVASLQIYVAYKFENVETASTSNKGVQI